MCNTKGACTNLKASNSTLDTNRLSAPLLSGQPLLVFQNLLPVSVQQVCMMVSIILTHYSDTTEASLHGWFVRTVRHLVAHTQCGCFCSRDITETPWQHWHNIKARKSALLSFFTNSVCHSYWKSQDIFFFSLYHYIKDVLYCKARLRFLEVTELKTKVSSLFYKLNPCHSLVYVKCVPIYKGYKLFFIQTKYDSKSVW